MHMRYACRGSSASLPVCYARAQSARRVRPVPCHSKDVNFTLCIHYNKILRTILNATHLQEKQKLWVLGK